MPKFDGFQRCRPFTRSTYFDMTESTLHNANGQNAGERKRIPTLMPLDVCARKIEPLAVKNPSEHKLGDERSDDRECRSFVALENAVEKMADEQDERYEKRRDVTIVEAQTKSWRRHWLNS